MTGLQIARNVSTATVTVAIKDNRWAGGLDTLLCPWSPGATHLI